MFEEPLSPAEIRVLGALIEKEMATPDYYPLTMNALVNACNQKSNRDPVVDYSEGEVQRAVDGLRDRQLAFRVSTVDGRVPKYEQNLAKKLQLTLQESAVLCVLMLRGIQTMGEIRGRTGRLYPFDDMEEVAVALDSLADRPETALVRPLPVQPGQKEPRFAHLLGGEPEIAEPALATRETHQMGARPSEKIGELETEVETLRAEIQTLKLEIAELKAAFFQFKRQFE